MTTKYRKKPVVIEAIQWTTKNLEDIFRFARPKSFSPEYRVPIRLERCNASLIVHTLEGDMICPPGSYIIRGVAGEYYPCREDIFNATYEKVEEEQS